MEKSRKPVILLSIIAVLVLWAGDAIVNAMLFHQGTSPVVLFFNMPPYKLYSGALLIAVMLILNFLLFTMTSKRSPVQAALRESIETLHIITDAAKDAIVMMDHEGNISFWNPAAEKIFGYAAHEAVGTKLHALLAPQRFQDAYREGFRKYQETGKGDFIGKMLELPALNKDGREIPIELSLSTLQLNGKWYAAGILRDITERKKSEEALQLHREQLTHLVEERTNELENANEHLKKEIQDRTRTAEELCRSERFLGTIFDSIHDPFSIVDHQYRIIKVNDAYARMKNKSMKDLLGRHCYEVLQNRNSICEDCVIRKTFQSSDPCAKEKFVTTPDGSDLWLEIYTYPIFDEHRKVSHVIEYARDITDRKMAERDKSQLIKELNYLSTTDSLTGLFNRRALNDILNLEIDRANRYGSDLSVMICDIDRFKQINDTCGHKAGDHALQAFSESLKQTLRKADIIGRYGGDEFMIILPETALKGAKSIAEKIRLAAENIELELADGRMIRFSTSVGVASCCAPMEDIDTIVARADAALYASKQAGRNKVSVVTA